MAIDAEVRTDESRTREASPTAYRTFSSRLSPVLIGLGAGTGALGALGAWVRTTTVASEGAPPEQVDVWSGASQGGGWFLAVVAAATVVAVLVWRGDRSKVLPAVAVSAVALLIGAGIRLVLIDRRAAEMVAAVRDDPTFAAYHAEFGWGAWLLLVSAVMIAVGLAIAGLRELDLKGWKTE
ncbi:MAG: hypothetical protein M3135_08000 [Actinomycetota bacterium]|nr:hypothetical protein [Actinomycetota bacterium]